MVDFEQQECEQRFDYLEEWTDRALSRSRVPEEPVLRARDNLIDAMLRRSDLGREPLTGRASRRAVFALAEDNLSWRLAEYHRARRRPDGSPRPRAALSLDEIADRSAAGEHTWALPPDSSATVDAQIEHRLKLKDVLSCAKAAGPTTAEVVVRYILGFGAREIGENMGLGANSVSARKSRFTRGYQPGMEG